MEKFDIDQLYSRSLPRMEVLEIERIALKGKLNKLKTISIGVTIIKAKENVVDPKMRLELSFQNNNVYISISTLKELFEPPVKTPVTDKDDFSANFKYLVNATSLLQQLTLAKSS